jgi:hypothetical protein
MTYWISVACSTVFEKPWEGISLQQWLFGLLFSKPVPLGDLERQWCNIFSLVLLLEYLDTSSQYVVLVCRSGFSLLNFYSDGSYNKSTSPEGREMLWLRRLTAPLIGPFL